MGTSLSSARISETFDGLLKTTDNQPLTGSLKEITDGLGNDSGVHMDQNGNLKAEGTLEFGSLKDTGEDITITKLVDEADGIDNNDNDTSIPTSAAVKDYVDTNSDYRLKENIEPLSSALDRLNELKAYRFNFISDPEATVDGFIAHEVADIIPEAVKGEKDAVDAENNPIYQTIDQSKIVPLLVGAVQELLAEVKSLKKK